MRMAMTMAMAVKMVREPPEAAIGHALACRVGSSVATGRHLADEAGATVVSIDKAHRYRANGPTAHHGQDDAARAFHVTAFGKIHGKGFEHLGTRRQGGQEKREHLTISCGESLAGAQLPEKCAAREWANPPNPPRVAWPEPDSDDVPLDERLDDESPPKKLLRDHDPPEPRYPPPDEELRGAHSVPPCGSDGVAAPPPLGSQFSLGIIAKAPPPTTSEPISKSATWRERLTGWAAVGAIVEGLRLPNSFAGWFCIISRSSRPR
jgi:hypothetical protein